MGSKAKVPFVLGGGGGGEGKYIDIFWNYTMILGSLRCHYGSGNEIVKKQLVKISNTTTHCTTTK